MLNQAVNRLRGQVRVRVETPFPERVLNLCGARDLAFWDMVRESETAFTCRLTRRDGTRCGGRRRKLDCRLTVLGREGVPFFLGRFRRRHALAAGLVLCGGLLLLGSFFIWDFEIEGNERGPGGGDPPGPGAKRRGHRHLRHRSWTGRSCATTCCWTSRS